jgi:hypothetical protein
VSYRSLPPSHFLERLHLFHNICLYNFLSSTCSLLNLNFYKNIISSPEVVSAFLRARSCAGDLS